MTNREAEIESTKIEGPEDEGLIFNFDDEAVAFYSNNKVKKFYKKPFNSKSKTSELKGGSSMKSERHEKKGEKKEVKSEDTKKERKLKGDSGFDFIIAMVRIIW